MYHCVGECLFCLEYGGTSSTEYDKCFLLYLFLLSFGTISVLLRYKKQRDVFCTFDLFLFSFGTISVLLRYKKQRDVFCTFDLFLFSFGTISVLLRYEKQRDVFCTFGLAFILVYILVY